MSDEELGELLEREAGLSNENFQKAQASAESQKKSLLSAIEDLGLVTEDKLLKLFAFHYQKPQIDLKNIENIKAEVLQSVSPSVVKKHRIIPIAIDGNEVTLASSDPYNIEGVEAVRFDANLFAKIGLASAQRIDNLIQRYYGQLDLSSLSVESSSEAGTVRQNIGLESSDESSIIKLVNDIILQCFERKASDIHFEVYEESMRVRLRIDGSLVEIVRPPLNMKNSLISRIKIMSGLNIAETRLPQDGAINLNLGAHPVDFRVNTLPTTNGEKIVMRILDKSNLQVDMTKLGFSKEQLEGFKEAIHRPHGMVLVTGPTGSGKTTTLYSAMQELNREEVNLMTAEDPVEYQLEGINQVAIKPGIGLNFAASLRAFLRQDPDVIMLGEIRDLETAEIAIKASLTGHLVLSTLHTNSAIETISRLLNMGVANFNLTAALNAVTAQRLLKRLCSNCKELDHDVNPDLLKSLGFHPDYIPKVQVYKSPGCSLCNNRGTRGRVAIHELLLLKAKVKEAIISNKTNAEIKRIAMLEGMLTLRQVALTKMTQGEVSLAEVLKGTAAD